METKLPDQAQNENAPLEEWLLGLNQHLSSEGAHSAEQAFSRGCSTSLVPAGLLLGLAFLLGARHWVSLLLIALAAAMLALAWAAFAASQAQRRSMERAFLASILPEIEQDLVQRKVTMEQIRQAARQSLPEMAPLRNCLDKIPFHTLTPNGVEHGE